MMFQNTGDGHCPDWVISCQNFDCGNGIYDAIIRRLLTERRAPGCAGGGWWCDPNFGMRKVTATSTTDAMAQVEDYSRQALADLETQGAIINLRTSAEYLGGGEICLRIYYTEPSGCDQVFALSGDQFGWLWNG